MIRAAVRRLRKFGRQPPKSLQERFPQFDIGEGSYGPIRVIRFSADESLRIGKYCSFAQDVTILLGGEHRYDWMTTFPFSELDPQHAQIEGHPRTKGPVIIGHDVWVGYGATILSGVTVGHGAVIGARSLVAADVPPYSIVSGNPASLRGYRFCKEVRQRLLDLTWWDWPREKIDLAMPHLLQGDPLQFLAKFETGGPQDEAR